MFAVVIYSPTIDFSVKNGGVEVNAMAKADIYAVMLFRTYNGACAWVDSTDGHAACVGRWHEIVTAYDTVDGCKDETGGEQ